MYDYLWRWDTDWFWCSGAFGVQNPTVRRLWPKRWRRSDVYHHLIGLNHRTGFMDWVDRRKGRPQREQVVQDIEVPVERLEEFLDWFDAEVGMRPVWLCPLVSPGTSTGSQWPTYPLHPGTTYVNVGFWGTVHVGPDAPDAPRNRAIEAKVSRAGRPQVALLRGVLRPRDLRPALRRSAPGRREAALRPRRPAPEPLRQGGTRPMTTLTLNKLSIAEALNSMLKEPLPLRFTAYDGSATGPEDSPYGIHLATERGLNYILTAPGDLGFGRAYVAGDLEVLGVHPGDPYEAFRLIQSKLSFRRPSPAEAVHAAALARPLAPAPAGPAAPGGAVPAAPDLRGAPALAGPRRRGDPPPLRRLQHLLRVRPRPLDDLHLRGLPDRGRDAGGGAGREVRPGRPQARPQGRAAAARPRLRLGRDGPPRRPRVRREHPRRDALPRAGVLGAGEDQGGGARPPRRGPVHGLPARRGDRLRRDLLDRADRAHRREELPGVLRLHPGPAAPAGPAAQPLHHPPRQPVRARPGSSWTATSSPTAS